MIWTSQDFPPGSLYSFWVDVHHCRAGAKFPRYRGDELRCLHCGRVEAYLFRPGLDQLCSFFEGANSTADSERHEDLFRDPAHHVEQNGPPFMTGGDVQEYQFVSPLLIVAAGNFDRITCIAEADEIRSFDHPPAVNVEAWDDPLGQHRKR